MYFLALGQELSQGWLTGLGVRVRFMVPLTPLLAGELLKLKLWTGCMDCRAKFCDGLHSVEACKLDKFHGLKWPSKFQTSISARSQLLLR
jgi:hypothetical protein